VWGIVAVVLLTLTPACDSPAPIRQYSIRTDVPSALAGDDRMLGLIAPQAQEAWFFKVTGPSDAIRFAEPAIREFLTGVRFQDGKPQLDEIPSGWSVGTERPMRFKTLLIDTPSRELELAISQLPRSGDWDEQISMNVNRWRGQMGMPDSEDRWAGAEPFELADASLAGEPAAWVDLSGKLGAGPGAMSSLPPMGSTPPRPPFAGTPATPPSDVAAGGSPSPSAPKADMPAAGSPAGDDSSRGLKYDAPPEWRAGKMSMMRMAAFEIGPADRSAELTIIQAGGDLRGNVDRWIGQLLGSAPEAETVDEAMEAAVGLTVGDRDAQRFYLDGSDPDAADAQAIDATIVPLENGMSLFVKATGPAETLREERERIGQFLSSLRLPE